MLSTSADLPTTLTSPALSASWSLSPVRPHMQEGVLCVSAGTRTAALDKVLRTRQDIAAGQSNCLSTTQGASVNRNPVALIPGKLLRISLPGKIVAGPAALSFGLQPLV